MQDRNLCRILPGVARCSKVGADDLLPNTHAHSFRSAMTGKPPRKRNPQSEVRALSIAATATAAAGAADAGKNAASSVSAADLPPSCRLYEAITGIGGGALTPVGTRGEGAGGAPSSSSSSPPLFLQPYLFARPSPCLEHEFERIGAEVPRWLAAPPVVDDELEWDILGDLFRPLYIDTEETQQWETVLNRAGTTWCLPGAPQTTCASTICQHYLKALSQEMSRATTEYATLDGGDDAQTLLSPTDTLHLRRNAFATLVYASPIVFEPMDYVVLLEWVMQGVSETGATPNASIPESVELGLVTLEIAVPCILYRWLRRQPCVSTAARVSCRERLLPDGLVELARVACRCAQIRELFLFPDWVAWLREHLRLASRAGLAGRWLEFELMRMY